MPTTDHGNGDDHGNGQSNGQGQGTTSGSGQTGPVSSTSTPGGVVGHMHVDTQAVDVASRRYLAVEDQLSALAQHVTALVNYRPTFGGVGDATWSSFLSSGYAEGAQGFAQAIKDMTKGAGDTSAALTEMSQAYTETEAANTRATTDLQRAFTPTG